ATGSLQFRRGRHCCFSRQIRGISAGHLRVRPEFWRQGEAELAWAAEVGDGRRATLALRRLLRRRQDRPEDADASSRGRDRLGRLLRLALKAHAEEGNYSAAEALYLQLLRSGCEPGLGSLHHLMEASLRTGGFAAARRWLPRLKALNPPRDAEEFLLEMERRFREAPVVNGTGRRFGEEVFSWSAVLGAAASCKDLEAAERWYVRAEAAKASIDAVAFGALIGASVKAGRQAAERWFVRLGAARAAPNVVVFGGLLAAAAGAGDFCAAEQWFERMLKAGVKPDARAFATIVDAAAKCQDLESVQLWLGRARRAPWTPRRKSATSGPLSASLKKLRQQQLHRSTTTTPRSTSWPTVPLWMRPGELERCTLPR
ncbi:unnamed protein product, partial [Polarella glacialis]